MIRLAPFDVPVDPDDEEARRLLEEELNRADAPPEEPPGWLEDFLDWLRELLGNNQPAGEPTVGFEAGPTVGIVIAVVLVVALLVIAFAIFGVPRLRRRSRVTGDLFGEDDDRSSSQIRSAADQAAADGDFTSAVVEVFRSLARDLAERGVVLAFPGTTAQEFGRRASGVFPDARERLLDAAEVFDGVRYLGRVGTEEQWRRMSELAAELRAARTPRAPKAAAAFGPLDETADVDPAEAKR
jgi:hypothetical protein